MKLERTPLAPELLSPTVARATAPETPPPAKMMAARGMLPGAGPRDLAMALYQLSIDADARIAQAALKTAAGLPDTILSAVLADALDPRVLDFYAEAVLGRSALIELVLLNRAAADATMVWLAATAGDKEVEIIAANQERVLRCPEIIEAIYMNKSARMSTVKRLLELAVRHGMNLSNLPQFKEIAAAILGEAQAAAALDPVQQAVANDEMDMGFAMALDSGGAEAPLEGAEGEELPQDPEQATRLEDMSIVAKLRLAGIGNSVDRSMLIKDSNKLVYMAVIKSPAVSDQEVVRYAANRSLSEEVIRYIANRKDWMKNYQVKVALANNPKCPLASSMRLLPHLRAGDLRALGRSKNIAAALAEAAKNLMRQRG